MDITPLVDAGVARGPAGQQAVRSARLAMGGSLPAQVEELYAATNGFLTRAGAHAYAADDLAERNATFEVDTACPDHVLIGDDSGGTGFLVSRTSADRTVYRSDLGDLDVLGFRRVANSLADWIATLA